MTGWAWGAAAVISMTTSMSFDAVKVTPQAEDEAIVAFHEGSRDEAYPRLVEMTDAGSSRPRLWLYRGIAERDSGRFDEAIESLERGLALQGELQRELRLELAVTRSWTGDAHGARLEYERVLAEQPGDRVALNGRARMLAWEGRLRAAEDGFEEVLELHPSDVEARLGLGFVHRAQMKPKAARRDYRRVLEDDPSNEDARRGLAEIDQMRRFEAFAAGTYAYMDGGVHSGGGELRLRAQAAGRVAVHGGYVGTAFVPTDPVSRGATDLQHVVEAGVVGQPHPRIFVGGGYRALLSRSLSHHAVSLDLAGRPTQWLTLSGTARPGLHDDGHVDVLSRVGAEAAVGELVSLSTQYFYYIDPTAQVRSHSVVGGAAVRPVRRLRLEARGGWLVENGRHGTIAMGQVDLALSERFELVGRYEYYHGGFDRHAVTAGLRIRF